MRLREVPNPLSRDRRMRPFFQSPRATRSGRVKRSASAGFSLLEMLFVVALILVMGAMAMPTLMRTQRNYHLNQAAAAVTGAIQATRYQAMMRGCPFTLAIPQTNAARTNATYQLQTQAFTGTPPTCAAAFSNYPVGGLATPWSSSQDVSLAAATTLQFNPNGTVQPVTGTLTLVLSNASTTNTITVSGVGNVKTTSP